MKSGIRFLGLTLLLGMIAVAAWAAGDFLGPLDANARFADGNILSTTGRIGGVIDQGAGFAPEPIAAVGILVDSAARLTYPDDANFSAVLSVQESSVLTTYGDPNWTETGLSFSLYHDPNSFRYLKVTGVTKRYLQLKGTLSPAKDANMRITAYVTRP